MADSISIFNYISYKKFLKRVIFLSEKKGIQSLMAEACGCQKSYFSQVLNSNYHLTLEHAAELISFLSLDDLEGQYFLDLVSYEKTSSSLLQARLKKNLQRYKKDHKSLSKKYKSDLHSELIEKTYYSSWVYSAIHITASIPEYQTVGTISKRLNLSEDYVLNILNELKNMKIVLNKGDIWFPGPGNIHLSNTSPYIGVHHASWRQLAVARSGKEENKGLHYTSVSSISLVDYEVLHSIILDFLSQVRGVVEKSEEEEIICLNIDYFKL